MKKIILGMAACAALCACTSDDLVDNSTSNSELTNGLYMKFKIELPTRSATTTGDADDYVTSSEGIEYGQDYENSVSNVLMMLATDKGEPIAFAKQYSGSSSSDTYYIATFEAAEIESYAGQEVTVVILCNTGVTGDSYNVDGTYTLTSETDETPWTENQFFMSNAKVYTRALPTDFSSYKDINNPYDIGTVKVERSCARFDYKDGSTTGNYTYPMMVDEEKAQINLVMEEVALINLSNSFYYLRRTAADIEGVADYTNTTLFGVEKANNWVIDTDAAEKAEYADDNLTDNFFCPLSSPSTWKWTSMSEIKDADNDDSWNNENTYGDYYIWRYATENTIPSVEQQKHGITTGIVFKCLMEPTDDCDENLAGAFDSGERIFVFANEVVGTWGMVEEYAKAYPLTALAAAYRNVLGDMNLDESLTLSEAQAKEGFTGYSPDNEGKYYVYYYYWNRHNDNKDNAEMGIMEFAVVRNNVYKLSVTDISLFGHPAPADPDDPNYDPNDPDPDPDPENPDDDDEDDNIYIQVEVEVLPWVVRVNDIKF